MKIYYQPKTDQIVLVQQYPVSKLYSYSTIVDWVISHSKPKDMNLIYIGKVD